MLRRFNPPALIISALMAVTAATAAEYRGTARIRFSGTSTLHSFHGSVVSTNVQFRFTATNWTASASVRVAEMDTDSRGRDRKMRRMFESERHPLIRGRVTNAPADTVAGSVVTLRLKIRDRELPVPVTISEWKRTDESLELRGTGRVSLKAFGLKPPSVLGVIRVGDSVQLEIAVTTKARR